MKRVILFCVFLFAVCTGFSQKIPADIQQRLDELQVEARERLGNVRTSNLGLETLPGTGLLSARLSPEQRERADSLGLELHWGMVYDEPMRERLIQLLNNEFREDEVENLVNRTMLRLENMGFEQDAMRAMGVFGTREFRNVQDSLNRHRDRTVRERLYQNSDVFRYLQLDTLAVFRHTMDSVKKQTREDLRIHYLNQRLSVNQMHMIVLASGHVGDERFIESLRNAMQRPDIDRMDFSTIRKALVRMKVEPYYSEFVEEFTFSIEEIKEMDFVLHLDYYTDLLRTQASFRELSKFLHSNAYTVIMSDGVGGNAYRRALNLIRWDIENEDLQALINSPTFDSERDILKVYDWMQVNYGNYIIRKVW